MTRTVHPHEIVVSVFIFAVLAGGIFWGGYAVGHSGVNDLRERFEAQRDLLKEAHSQGYLVDDKDPWQRTSSDPIRVNVECHGDASDWATIEMANEVGFNYDLPVFVHGNCQTHEVVNVPTDAGNPLIGFCSMSDDKATIESVQDNAGHSVVCPKRSHGEIVNVPAEEGR